MRLALAFLLTFLVGAAVSTQLHERVQNKQLEDAAKQLLAAELHTQTLRLALGKALMRDVAYKIVTDSLVLVAKGSRERWQNRRNTLPPVPEVVPGCEAWANRCEALQGTLLEAEGHIEDLGKIIQQDTVTIDNLRSAVGTAHAQIGTLEQRLADIKIPTTKKADPRLLLIGEVRVGDVNTGTLALGSRVLPGTDLYVGREFAVNQPGKWVIGGRTTIRLR